MLTIDQIRKKIDQIDANIIKKLAERQALCRQIGMLKIEEGRNVFDAPREKKLFEVYSKLAEKYSLQQDYVKRLFKVIIAYSKRVQK